MRKIIGDFMNRIKELTADLPPDQIPVFSLIALCRGGVYLRNFTEVDGWLQQVSSRNLLEADFDQMLKATAKVVQWQLEEGHCEEAKTLLRNLAANMQTDLTDPEKASRLLTDKLAYLVEYGRAVGLEQKTIEQLFSSTLDRVALSTRERVQYFQRAATRLAERGLYKDALVMFLKAPRPH
jgi:hypothetical protein